MKGKYAQRKAVCRRESGVSIDLAVHQTNGDLISRLKMLVGVDREYRRREILSVIEIFFRA